MRDTGKTPWGILLCLIVVAERVDFGVALNVVDLCPVH